MKTSPHIMLTLQIRALRLPKPEHEFRFHPRRLWRFDLAYPERKIGVEIHGGTWIRGRHQRGEGFTKDRQKMNAATELGWSVYEFTTEMVNSGEAVRTLQRVLL